MRMSAERLCEMFYDSVFRMGHAGKPSGTIVEGMTILIAGYYNFPGIGDCIQHYYDRIYRYGKHRKQNGLGIYGDNMTVNHMTITLGSYNRREWLPGQSWRDVAGPEWLNKVEKIMRQNP